MTAAAQETGIFLLGRNNLSREGLRLILEEGGFRIIASQGSYSINSAWPKAPDFPHLIAIDVSTSDGDIDISPYKSAYPSAFIVFLVEKFDLEKMTNAFNAGIHGYIVKEISCESLIESLRLVCMGEKVMPSALVHFLPNAIKAAPDSFASSPASLSPPASLLQALSGREIETFRHMCLGEANKIIAQKLSISEATVKVHVKAILRKLNMRNRTQAVAWAFSSGYDFSNPAFAGHYMGKNEAPNERLFAA